MRNDQRIGGVLNTQPPKKRSTDDSPVDRLVTLPWVKEPPSEQGWYWWWNEDPDSLPVPVSILRSSDGDCFASKGQLGWNTYQPVEEMGGQWIRLIEPETAM
jgi:hypothetical protein